MYKLFGDLGGSWTTGHAEFDSRIKRASICSRCSADTKATAVGGVSYPPAGFPGATRDIYSSPSVFSPEVVDSTVNGCSPCRSSGLVIPNVIRRCGRRFWVSNGRIDEELKSFIHFGENGLHKLLVHTSWAQKSGEGDLGSDPTPACTMCNTLWWTDAKSYRHELGVRVANIQLLLHSVRDLG